MLILAGLILSIGASLGTYFGFGFHNMSLWYLFLLIPFVVTYFVIYLNIYWGLVLIRIHKYKEIEFPGKVDKLNLLNVRLVSSFILTLRLIFIRKKNFKTKGLKPGLYLFNHITDYDPWAIYKIMGGRYALVGKKALRGIPMVRQLASSIGTLYVDNGDKELNEKFVTNAVDYITNKDTSVVVAPEGTRSFNGKLNPFKHGCFHIAKDCKCPIYFIGFKGMEKASNKSSLKPALVQIELFGKLEPNEYEGKSAGEIALMCEEKYRQYLGQ